MTQTPQEGFAVNLHSLERDVGGDVSSSISGIRLSIKRMWDDGQGFFVEKTEDGAVVYQLIVGVASETDYVLEQRAARKFGLVTKIWHEQKRAEHPLTPFEGGAVVKGEIIGK